MTLLCYMPPIGHQITWNRVNQAHVGGNLPAIRRQPSSSLAPASTLSYTKAVGAEATNFRTYGLTYDVMRFS